MSVSTKECDYLDEDPALRGQNFVCLSFLSPENELKNKEIFTFSRFLSQFASDTSLLFDGLAENYPGEKAKLAQIKENNAHIFEAAELENQYKFFKSTHGDALETEFHELNEFKTTVRGIKVRGVFDTLKEAQIRAQVLKKTGDKFDIFIGQVGVWCPWSPNPELLDQEYSETQLNTLMKKYKENMDLRDEMFQDRKQSKITSAIASTSEPATFGSPVSPVSPVLPDLQAGDAWLDRQTESKI